MPPVQIVVRYSSPFSGVNPARSSDQGLFLAVISSEGLARGAGRPRGPKLRRASRVVNRLARLARTADNTGATVATVPSGDGHRITVGSWPSKTGTKSPRSFVRGLGTRVGWRLFAASPLPRACVTTPSALFWEEV